MTIAITQPAPAKYKASCHRCGTSFTYGLDDLVRPGLWPRDVSHRARCQRCGTSFTYALEDLVRDVGEVVRCPNERCGLMIPHGVQGDFAPARRASRPWRRRP